MCTAIKYKFIGRVTQLKAINLSYEASFGMQNTIKVNFLDVVVACQTHMGKFESSALRDSFLATCPEHVGSSGVDWKKLEEHTRRITPESYDTIIRFKDSLGMGSPPVAQKQLELVTFIEQVWGMTPAGESRNTFYHVHDGCHKARKVEYSTYTVQYYSTYVRTYVCTT